MTRSNSTAAIVPISTTIKMNSTTAVVLSSTTKPANTTAVTTSKSTATASRPAVVTGNAAAPGFGGQSVLALAGLGGLMAAFL